LSIIVINIANFCSLFVLIKLVVDVTSSFEVPKIVLILESVKEDISHDVIIII